MTKKKTKKKTAKRKERTLHEVHKEVLEMDSFRILAAVKMEPGVEEILAGNEAKLYLTGLQRARSKLQAVIDRELVKMKHPGHATPVDDD